MIDADRTLSVLGVDVSTLTPGSGKKVFRVCEECGQYKKIRYCEARTHSICRVCVYDSEEYKHKLSESLMGHVPWNKGNPGRQKHTEASKQKIREALKGIRTPEKTKRKMSDASTKRYESEDERRKQSARVQGIPYSEWESYACEKKYCPKFNEACRESNRKKYGGRCFICGMTEEDNGQKLSVHHVDMDKAQGCKSNWILVPLCRSCHNSAHNNEMIARLGYILKKAM